MSGGVRGTLPWMAPELLSGKSNMVTEKVVSDVITSGVSLTIFSHISLSPLVCLKIHNISTFADITYMLHLVQFYEIIVNS